VYTFEQKIVLNTDELMDTNVRSTFLCIKHM